MKIQKKKKRINKLIIFVRQYPLLDSVCRVFLFSYSCGWFSSFACPSVFSAHHLCRVGVCGGRWRAAAARVEAERGKGERWPADLCDGTPIQARNVGKALAAWDALPESSWQRLYRSSQHMPTHCDHAGAPLRRAFPATINLAFFFFLEVRLRNQINLAILRFWSDLRQTSRALAWLAIIWFFSTL